MLVQLICKISQSYIISVFLFIAFLTAMATTGLQIRSANLADLPQIRNLIQDSFLAMVEFSGEESRPSILEASKGSMNQDLTDC
jgi:hypothetical protein